MRNSELPVVRVHFTSVITLAFTIFTVCYRLPSLLQYAPYQTSLQNECRKTKNSTIAPTIKTFRSLAVRVRTFSAIPHDQTMLLLMVREVFRGTSGRELWFDMFVRFLPSSSFSSQRSTKTAVNTAISAIYTPGHSSMDLSPQPLPRSAISPQTWSRQVEK